ncbi:hypothetical protein [Stutzerimonas kunmingensis]|uniref:hypothetical protein n=1 Tax=Stutzerimonas kunmingensis TaxID=1211807 RepID=UPI00241EE936|nr:hypothetical protein [Stutzerimonas kunmingensis]
MSRSELARVVSKPGRLYLLVLLTALAGMQGYLFLTGYRLTADDVDFQYHLMNGWGSAWDFTWLAAVSQGRVVHLLDVPFSMIAAYFADNFAFRLLYTSLYFACFAMLAVYVSMLARLRIAALITLVLLSLHPLDYFHLPPNAYPAHLTLPFLLILLARLGLLRARAGRRPSGGGWEAGMLACCFVGIMFSEYAFLFAAALMGAEFFVRLTEQHVGGGAWGVALRSSLLHRSTLKDAFVLALFLVIYLAFRAEYPSTYEGNQLAGELDLAAVGRTLLGHVFGGTSLASLARYGEQLPGVVRALGYLEVAVLTVIVVVTFVAGMLGFQRVRHRSKNASSIRRCWAIVVTAMLGAVLVTLPLALTAKYQAWCGDLSACIFLDSRVSYLAVGAMVAALMVMGVAFMNSGRLLSVGVPVIGSAMLAGIGGLTYLNNVRIEWDMERYVAGWDRAGRLACVSTERLDEVEAMLPQLIDPGQRISMSPGFDRGAYWRDYIELQRKRQGTCHGAVERIGDVYPPLQKERVSFAVGGSGTDYLATGWYAQESWGVWSQGSEAQVYLPVQGAVDSLVIEAHALLLPEHSEQPMVLSVNGMEVGRVVLDKPHDNRIELDIPPSVNQEIGRLGLLILQLRFLDPVNQKTLGLGEDNRTLALGLRFITVQEQPETNEDVGLLRLGGAGLVGF